MSPFLRRALIALCFVAVAHPARAQRRSQTDDRGWLEDCTNGGNGDHDRGRACEVRAVAVRVSGQQIDIDGRQNGSVHVIGWSGDSIRATARLQANARDDGAARDLLRDVRISSEGGRIRADGPRDGSRDGSRSESWSVSYVVYVPRRFDLQLDANNGSLAVEGVTGRLDMRTTNGSVALVDVGGDVKARTQNGSVRVELDGTRWDGKGLDAETQNGSVRMSIPSAYAALIETATVNGRMSTDFPITVRGRIGKHMSLPLNGGGATLRAVTTNGSVVLTRQ